jgi:hypothetical protein
MLQFGSRIIDAENARSAFAVVEEGEKSRAQYWQLQVNEICRHFFDVSTALSDVFYHGRNRRCTFEIVFTLDPADLALLRHIQFGLFSVETLSPFEPYFEIIRQSFSSNIAGLVVDLPAPRATPRVLDSQLILDSLEIFAEFQMKPILFLWPGSHHGADVYEFHRRCDKEYRIFCGFTPVECESGESHWWTDDNLKSFGFTLKSGHDLSARGFALKAEEKQ